MPIGKGVVKRRGEKTAILSFGTRLQAALTAAEKINATVVDMRFVKPLDIELIREIATTHALLVTLEEHAVMGGAGSAVNEHLAQENIIIPILNLGIPDAFIEHGTPAEMLEECGLDAAGIEQAIRHRVAQNTR